MKPKTKNTLVIVISLIMISVAVYLGSNFSFIDTSDVPLHQYNGQVELAHEVVKSGTARFGDLEIIQSRGYYEPVITSDYYCGKNTCGGVLISTDEWGCERWRATKTKNVWLNCKATIYTKTWCNCRSGDINKCYDPVYPDYAGWTKSTETTTTDCGGRMRDQVYQSACHHKFSVKKGGTTLFSQPDFMRDSIWYYIPVRPKGELVEKELNLYENSGGYIDCPYLLGETIQSCEATYGRHQSMRNYLVEKSEVTEVAKASLPIPYPTDGGIWGTIGQRKTTEGRNYILAEFKRRSELMYGNCQLIENSYRYPIGDEVFDIHISSPKKTYYEGENASVEITVFNFYEEDTMMRLNVLYAIPTAFGDKEKQDFHIVSLKKGQNIYSYDIPTEQVIEEVRVTVSGEIVVPGSFFDGINAVCPSKSLLGNAITPANDCDYIILGEVPEQTDSLKIERVREVPSFCQDKGIFTIQDCDEYIIGNFNDLNLGIDEKIDLINSLNIDIEDKLAIIENLEVSEQEKELMIEKLNELIDAGEEDIQKLKAMLIASSIIIAVLGGFIVWRLSKKGRR